MAIDSSRFTKEQNYLGLNLLVCNAKESYYQLTNLWQESRDNKDYKTSDKLRDILRELEWGLLYWGELKEEETKFNADRIK
jgi:cysteinyl-tRNA synthetase